MWWTRYSDFPHFEPLLHHHPHIHNITYQIMDFDVTCYSILQSRSEINSKGKCLKFSEPTKKRKTNVKLCSMKMILAPVVIGTPETLQNNQRKERKNYKSLASSRLHYWRQIISCDESLWSDPQCKRSVITDVPIRWVNNMRNLQLTMSGIILT